MIMLIMRLCNDNRVIVKLTIPLETCAVRTNAISGVSSVSWMHTSYGYQLKIREKIPMTNKPARFYSYFDHIISGYNFEQ